MRAKRIIAFSFVIAILFVVVYLLRYLGNPHRVIDTAGKIVYASDSGSPGKSHVFLIRADGSGAQQLTHGDESDIEPSFSPDGSQIVFISDRSGSPQVYLMDADGLGAHALTVGTDSKTSPQFGPDGQHIGYITRGQLAVTDVNGGETNLILPVATRPSDQSSEESPQAIRAPVLDYRWEPSTDPNKQIIAAIQDDPKTSFQAVSLVNLATGNPVVAIEAPTVTIDWSPDGSKLAVAALGLPIPGGHELSAIVLFNPDGSQVQQAPIAGTPTASEGPQDPAFLPDGQRIAFTAEKVTKLGTVDTIGIGITSLTPGGQVQLVTRGPVSEPQFSPDGSYGMFLGTAGPKQVNHGLYVITLSTGQGRMITDKSADVTWARWSPALPKPSH